MTRYVEERRGTFGVEPVCRVLGVAVSTHYARRSRKPSRRELRDRELIREIQAARAGYRRVYGVRKTWKELRRRGVDVGRDRVARLMRRQGLEGVRRGKKRRTTVADEAALERARDLVQRDFTASRPNEKWVCDLSYLRTWQGFVYSPSSSTATAAGPFPWAARRTGRATLTASGSPSSPAGRCRSAGSPSPTASGSLLPGSGSG